MKKIICIIATVVVSLSILAGCQKTPESPVVVGKDNDKMIETAESLEDKSLTIREQVSAPESVKMNFKDQTGKIKFSVDAEVIVPDAEAFTKFCPFRPASSCRDATFTALPDRGTANVPVSTASNNPVSNTPLRKPIPEKCKSVRQNTESAAEPGFKKISPDT